MAWHVQYAGQPYHHVLSCQVAELRAERDRLLNDKSSLHSQIAELRAHYASLGLASGQLGSHRASQEADSARSEALTQLQAAQLSHERTTREWEAEKQQLQVPHTRHTSATVSMLY